MLAAGLEEARGWCSFDDLLEGLAVAMPVFARVPDAAPLSPFRLAGEKIPREPHRFSGRTSMLANISVHEPKPPDDPDSALSYSMEGYPGQPPPPLTPFFWSPGWNSYQAVNKFQEEIAGPLRGDTPVIRLVEPVDGAAGGYFDSAPEPFARPAGEWLIVPLDHIFASEELGHAAPAVQSLAPEPHLALNAADAAQVGEQAEVSIGNANFRVPVRIRPELPEGVAGLLAGVGPLDGLVLPAWGKIGRVS
jgi:NADH-quinone oxidoreductase subunit G